MKLCDRIPVIPGEEDIVRNELQKPNLGKPQHGTANPQFNVTPILPVPSEGCALPLIC